MLKWPRSELSQLWGMRIFFEYSSKIIFKSSLCCFDADANALIVSIINSLLSLLIVYFAYSFALASLSMSEGVDDVPVHFTIGILT